MGLFSSRIASIFRALDFGRKTADPTLIVGSYLLEAPKLTYLLISTRALLRAGRNPLYL